MTRKIKVIWPNVLVSAEVDLARIGDGLGIGTILDDDDLPEVQAEDLCMLISISLSLTRKSALPVQVCLPLLMSLEQSSFKISANF